MPAAATKPDSKLTGSALIADYVKRLPAKPGVYRMLNASGDVLYVGKAKSLRNRVSNYASMNGHSNRIARMIAETRQMEFVVTESETEALLLEANLIKTLKPRFNVLLRDDKSFSNILIATDHAVPQILKHRGVQKRPGQYFGPFASAGAVNRTLNTMQKAFLLRSCSDSVYDSRTRPCLLHQIKRCSAPCTGEVTKAEYDELVDEALAFLKGRNRDVTKRLSKEMEEASERMEFERAARLRDRIRALAFIQETQGINTASVGEADVFAVHADGGAACVQAFFFRAGQNLGNVPYFPKVDDDVPTGEIMGAWIAQFYDGRMPPALILLSEDVPERELLAEALTIKAGRKVEILVPARGDRRELTRHALMNAREALGRKLSDTQSQRKLMAELQETLGLSAPPRRVECYDNSHLGGTGQVGAMIVSDEEGFARAKYRKFNIKDETLSAGDDFGMMREVMKRRFSRLLKESKPGDDDWPSLVVIDGGEGQLGAARWAMAAAGITVGTNTAEGEVALVSISKPRRETASGARVADRSASAAAEQIHMPGRQTFLLPPRSPVLYYLQRLRDEAHRFVIGAQKAKRAQEMKRNPLDAIEGVGAGRKKALLNHFGSAKAVARAKRADLEAVDGISEQLAERIYDHFHG
ncbi:excinuclease ABC subunit UvrC [Parvularcula dongshanensis]|uniref:UvrABC system protein C n=1 Tax=Parvularcula dongshanensis TaxID=1173995 RepID=A0A840I1Z9_9PROT|nr:excinuclease ABC subunit UvrC [Parvularcula dongshanensis]MBB4658777.1 excinuclease ABC subunit C [Parvularcula dongshanensis]